MKQSGREENKPKRRFSEEQYQMLLRCSGAKNMTEWNEWRVNNPKKDVLLEGAKLDKSYLKGAFLNKGEVEWDNKRYKFTGEVYLEGARLYKAHLENAYLEGAHLENAYLEGAHLENADLEGAHLENARLWEAHLENARLLGANLRNASFRGAHLKNAELQSAHLENAYLKGAHLENARLWNAHLENAILQDAHLENADFEIATVDGKTLVWECEFDCMTNFQGVGLGSIRIDPQTKQLLEHNIRRMNWEEWYKEHLRLKWLVKPFWLMSDYGLSTSRVVATFFSLAIIFATVYFVWGALDYYCLGIKDQPGIVEKLFVPVAAEDAVSDVTYLAMVYFRSIYFSIVTMTTLGFGDMYANATRCEWRWWFGHLLLMVQVILGYVLLAALVTRFAVLFTAGGPAGEFAEGKKETPQ